ncbi:MAG TPA: TIGR03085 family metal-binding protein [Streptosporangiaceae bacterium]|nr:TIGR03085 family metal-binding protein [Streptosporangiaceae bacterium]
MTYAREERLAVADLLTKLGPDQPTLCAGWKTLDLAAHLVMRERRPDAGLGVLGGPLAGYTRRVQGRYAARNSYAGLVEQIRTGPPRLSLFALPGADERGNTVEYFVHHEDIRRAQPRWEPRELSPGLSDLLWQRLRLARLMLRRAPVGVEFARDADAWQEGDAPLRITAKARAPMVTVTGTPAELTMWAFGRAAAARVRLEGSDPDVAALAAAGWRH